MFASSPGPRARRRGIVLVLVLGMLGLMALIGVTFATFAGQSLINGRNFMQGVARPQPEVLMDYALAQLINDTSNPASSLRGHSFLRDMFGNDSVFRGSNPPYNPAAETRGLMTNVHINGGFFPLQFTGYSQHSTAVATPFYNQLQYATNIPTTGQYFGLDFTRWIVRFPFNGVAQSFEILEDDTTTTPGFHTFTLNNNLTNPTRDLTYNVTPAPVSSGDWTAFIYNNPNLGLVPVANNNTTNLPPYNEVKTAYSLGKDLNNSGAMPSAAFVLDGRYMRAFNGPGLTQLNTSLAYPYNVAANANFRINGLDPDSYGMDEDYDACDLENWFLALQSADGEVMIPSFHRPGILMAADWTTTPGAGNPKILRPRQADNSPLFPVDPAFPDPTTGKLTFDVDNDGDGVTDSVWMDLGYPVQRDPGGKLYKPLFAFMILGLNGRLPLNTVGNLQARAIGDQLHTSNPTGDTRSVIPGTLPSSTTQIDQPGFYTDGSPYFHLLSSQTYNDAPLWDHASHLGYSVNEINPKFALQNAPSNLYPGNGIAASAYGVFTDTSTGSPQVSYSQYDNAGVSVALTQMRNILAGTIPTDITNPYTGTFPITLGSAKTSNGSNTQNMDVNAVVVGGQWMILPNNMADGADTFPGPQPNTPFNVFRSTPPTPGRWGEPEGITQFATLPAAGSPPFNNFPNSNVPISFPPLIYNNPVRAGRSFYNDVSGVSNTNDAMDDDQDSSDFLLSLTNNPLSNQVGDQGTLPFNATTNIHIFRNYPEQLDTFDNAGQIALASERIRRFTTPIDPSGAGRVVDYFNRPDNDHDYGYGYDRRGRVGYFRYFRPAGMPQEIRYPYQPFNLGGNSNSNYPYAYPVSDGNVGQQYLMPILYPAGQTVTNQVDSTTGNPLTPDPRPRWKSDILNNQLHGFQSMLTPVLRSPFTPPHAQSTYTFTDNSNVIASMAPMPYDWDVSAGTATPSTGNPPPGGPPTGYGNSGVDATGNPLNQVPLGSPTINPNYPPLQTAVNSNWGPVLNDPPSNGSTATPYGINYPASVVNGYLGGSLNQDEADEMNLYVPNRSDMPFGPSDLEWLYRKQDVDGATLDSRLSQLAPVSFLNPADGLTRRRLFSTDASDLISFSYANDNPAPYAGAAYTVTNGSQTFSATTDHNFTYNARFSPIANANLEGMNQVSVFNGNTTLPFNPNLNGYANPITTFFLPNVTLPPQAVNVAIGDSYGNGIINSYVPNSAYIGKAPIALPLAIDPSKPNTAASPYNTFSTTGISNAITGNFGLIVPAGPVSSVQVPTPSVAHRDRKINLNFPLPISNDPAEPIRQKWVRETYQFLKAILPPASVDTPEELAALSQFVVNIIDFRDPDCSMTRFVNTDLIVTDVLTRTASNAQKTAAMSTMDTTWNVSPAGVRFATGADVLPVGRFPYDPSIYSPDATTPFLVQHGMEYNPIALNEVFAFQSQYSDTTKTPAVPGTNQALFIELVNTLTEEQNNQYNPNNPTAPANASAILMAGWDIVLTPDNYGWGRPDPISGDVNSIAYPPKLPGDPAIPSPATLPPPNVVAPLNVVKQHAFTVANSNRVQAINAAGNPRFTVVGVQTAPAAANPEKTAITPTIAIPNTFLPQMLTPSSGKGQFYWLYLRRPANPFDDQPLTAARPNREMVVVDAIRFPYIEGGGSAGGAPIKVTQGTAALWSARRLQPYRGGHLVPINSPPGTPATDTGQPYPNGTAVISAAAGVPTICPPSPAYAYGYTEQMAPLAAASGNYAQYSAPPTPPTAISQNFNESISTEGNPHDSHWSLLPFHDRDFTSAAELLLVPGCPPGLFTKQFVEEPYPGNISYTTGTAPNTTTVYTTGWDDQKLNNNNKAPNPAQAEAGRGDFGAATGVTPSPTFPYLTDNFYYTAASVAPPIVAQNGKLDPNYNRLTTEIGGWTGAGWHKMLEFFEVPSSANGAIGPADGGNNFDWYRSDTRPGQINLNLIIDEEVFAGVFDDPRLNDRLAAYGTVGTIPFVVSQIDANGYPARIPTSAGNAVFAQQPIFPSNHLSTNILNRNGYDGLNPGPNPGTVNSFGRGYVYRDPDVQNYVQPMSANTFQQVHGLKAAFSDFLKLRHGGSGYLFAYGAGPTGAGDFLANPALLPPSPAPTQPIASERPFRSLSYADINYTILRPASLPPSPLDTAAVIRFPGTTNTAGNPLPPALAGMFSYMPYNGYVTPNSPPPPYPTPPPPFVQQNLLMAPMNQALTPANPPNPAPSNPATQVNFQYNQDPGIKNPYLSIQYINQTSPYNTTDPVRNVGTVSLAPPYAVPNVVYTVNPAAGTPPPTPPPAPFPPPIPPTPARRLLQVPDADSSLDGNFPSSNADLQGGLDANGNYPVNQPVTTRQLSSMMVAPPSLVRQDRAVFAQDNYTPQSGSAAIAAYSAAQSNPPAWYPQVNNYLGASQPVNPFIAPAPNVVPDYRQHPLYRIEWLQKISNLTTVRTQQFAVWITVGFFEVVRPGTPELSIPDVLGQELGQTSGAQKRYRSFFVVDRTKATGFNPYFPGNFRDCVTYRRRIE